MAAGAAFVCFCALSRAPSFFGALPPQPFGASCPFKKPPPPGRHRRGELQSARGRGASLNGVSQGQRAAGEEAGVAGVSVGLERGVTQLTRAGRRGEWEGGREVQTAADTAADADAATLATPAVPSPSRVSVLLSRP